MAMLPSLDACWQWRVKSPWLSAAVLTLTWDVEPDGHVSGMRVAESTASRDIDQCVYSAVARYRFAPVDDDTSDTAVFIVRLDDTERSPYWQRGMPGLSRRAIWAGLHSGEPVRDCYEAVLKVDPDAEGTVTITFVVNPQGAVVSTASQVAGRLPEVGTCVEGMVKRFTFPAPLGGQHVTITRTLTFKPTKPRRRPKPTSAPTATGSCLILPGL